jgi:choline monooxygenase
MPLSLHEKLSLFDAELPLERARSIPACWYTDADVYAAERRHVFGNTWLVAGRVDQLAGPGSYFTTEIAGEPILVLRDAEGTPRAFYNVCRHRAARVMTASAGMATKLRCPYHGWTYDLAGRLRGTPEWDGVADFCREDNGLRPLAVALWGPFVWVHAEPVTLPLAEFLAPLPERTAGLGLETLRWVERREYELACNWKVFVDNYLDGGYHINSVHPGLAGILDYSQYETEIAGFTCIQSSPLRPVETRRDDGSVGKVRSGRAYYCWVFPNVMFNIYDGLMDTNLVLPLGPDRCRVVFDFYFARTEGDERKKYIAESIAVAHQIQLEDGGICEDVQRGLGSRSYDTARFSVRREGAEYHFNRLLAERLRAAAS